MIAVMLAVLTTLVVLTTSGCTVNSKEELAQSADIDMAEAVKIAEASVPGIAVTAEITDKEGVPTYLVEVVDARGEGHLAYVDARNGQTLEIDGDVYSTPGAPQNGRAL